MSRRMTKSTEKIKCWVHFNCKQQKCPAYRSKDLRCWLKGSSYCHPNLNATWLEKMEACIRCEVFVGNFSRNDCSETFSTVSHQFEDYRKKVEEKQDNLIESQKKLEEFKRTSIYLLKELDKKTQEVQNERDNLERRVRKKTEELHKAQAKLIQTTKMAAIGRFSAGIAHEINNPLGAIINFARTLLGNPEIKGQNRGYLELILKGLFRIENVVKQILSHSRKPQSEPEPTDLNQLIQESIDFVRNRIEDKMIRLEMKLANPLPKMVIDPSQIQQVFINILKNAIDAVDQKGSIIIESILKNELVEIHFKDNGVGIKKSDMEKLYDPFFTTKEVGEGTGLGLFICYNILQIYGGNIEISSKKGTGTQVIVRLPMSGEK